ncbi:MAG: acyl-ACP--UDP-N-acetylglucosamine O-acyltransferase [Gammaproteobacteria bacterium]|jgi:UDP-N-acetylglucosamine acyltransferase|nr:acyl-ACP--UDP-N-acetylglucosamine O-acyltransferase [Gammaproteobacteria bacterium]
MNDVHPTAVIGPEVELDDGVSVGAYAVIDGRVRIGAGSRIGPHCVVRGTTTIGRNNRIFQFASIGEDPQDKKYAGEDTELVIGDGNTIREYCTLNRGTVQDKGVTRIGDNNWLMAYVHIAHDCTVGNETIFANCVTLAGHVTVDDYVILGGFSGAHQFARIGAHAFVANNAAVSRDVPPYVMAAGQPAAPRGLNTEGLRRRGFTPEQVRRVKEVFRLLYRSDLRLEEAREQIRVLAEGQPEVEVFSRFIEPSERGLIR